MAQPLRQRRAWLGVDLGTQSVRAVLVDEDGTVLGRGAVPLTSRRWPDGRHEQDPESWWDAVATASRQALAEAGPARVQGVACCSTSGTVLLVRDAAGAPAQPLTAGLMYDDGRAVDEGRLVENQPADVWSRLGLVPQRSWAVAKAVWLLRHAVTPADRRALSGVRLAHQADLVTSRLVGRPTATDTSHALKSGADPLTPGWPVADLERLGVDPEVLPSLVRPGTVLGGVCREAAERTGLPEGTPVIAGMTDGCAAQIAAGVLRPGEWSFGVGTTLVLKGVSAELVRDPSGALYSHRSPDGLWWPGGASSAGAGALEQEFPGADLDALLRRAAEREPAGCVTYPLVGVGERFPFRCPEARRLTLGEPRDDADRLAAVLQGVAFVERLCLDHVRVLGAPVAERVTVTGGATRSEYWTQLQADVLRREVAVPRHAEGAFGMAVLAAASRDGLSSAAGRMVRPARVHRPRDTAGVFDAPYRRLVSALAERGWIPPELADAATAEVAP